jgi:hemerythrin-like metal-binding protein
MLLDLIWTAGTVLCIAGLLYGAYLVLMETGPVLSLLGKKPLVPLTLPVKDLRLIDSLVRSGPGVHSPSGNPVLDTEHLGLFNDMNNLRAAIRSGQPVNEVYAAIDVVIRDVVQHFQDEEAILMATGYPGTSKHVALHRELVSYATARAGRIHTGLIGVGELFRSLARDVLARHMLDADQEFISYSEGRQ